MPPPDTAALDAPTLRHLLVSAFDGIAREAATLSELDRVVGDGDHGTTMARLADHVRERLRGGEDHIGPMLAAVGTICLDSDGGATGPLVGSLFVGMARAAGDRARLDGDELAAVVAGGVSAVRALSRADVGDKTMMDALLPAAAAMARSAQHGEPVEAQLEAAAEAAELGAIATRGLRARFGRSKHLGERVIGHEDPGARSMAILFRGLSDAYTGMLKEGVERA